MTNHRERHELAREWISSTAELRSLTDPVPATQTLIQRVRKKLTARESEARARALRLRRHTIKRFMEYQSLGGDAREWGVLSGGQLDSRRVGNGSFLLEDTLEVLTRSNISASVATEIRQLLTALPDARANAALGETSTVADIETRTLALSESPDFAPHQRRRLIEHLPAVLRPIPASLASLERGQPPVTLFISLQGEDMPYSHPKGPVIRLHDIVVAYELQGKGLGTAALTELCNYADLHSLPIEGMLEPGPGKPDEAVAAVSRWYARMGFTQGENEPHQWQRGGNIHRAPLTPSPQT